MSALYGRIAKGPRSQTLPWVSRDYETVPCLAVGCMFNRDKECMVPTRFKLGPDARCEGFQAPPNKTKVDGD